MSARFRESEYQLIYALGAGNEKFGVIGNTARAKLKRMPSSMYWAALRRWNIRNGDQSPEAYFRRQYEYRRLADRTAKADDPETLELLLVTDLDPHLPKAPDGFLGKVDFALLPEEEQYLSDVIGEATPGSMLAWLIRAQPGNAPDYVWQLDNLREAPEQLQDLIDHARRFHTAVYGAALLYNLLLARQSDRDELVEKYESDLSLWRDELQVTKALEGWRRADWWGAIRSRNPRLRQATVNFVNNWLDIVESDVAMATDTAAIRLITSRERQIKGGRARMVNQAALDRWSGSSGLSRLDYRWPIAQRHLTDLYAARQTA